MFFESISDLNPSPEAIAEFDKELHAANEDILVEQMTAAGLSVVDVVAKSQILLYSQSAAGGTATEQIANACQFFKNTQNL